MKRTLLSAIISIAAGRLRTVILLAAAAIVGFAIFHVLTGASVPRTFVVSMKIPGGTCVVRHERWEPGNPIVSVECTGGGVVAKEVFLIQRDVAHLLIEGKKAGSAEIVLKYKSGDTRVLSIQVTDDPAGMANHVGAGAVDVLQEAAALEEARAFAAQARSRHANRHNNLQDHVAACHYYSRAMERYRSVSLYAFSDEYRTVSESAAGAQEECESLVRRLEGEFESAREKDDHARAEKALKALVSLFSFDRDSREYLRYRTYLEYHHY